MRDTRAASSNRTGRSHRDRQQAHGDGVLIQRFDNEIGFDLREYLLQIIAQFIFAQDQ